MDNITLVYYDYETKTTLVDRDMPFNFTTAEFSLNEKGGKPPYWYKVMYYNDEQKVAFAVRIKDE